ncbi:MAG: hypothetical protein D6B26_06615 [Spirochaetaceae bacterium]|nr:MAG: hypothetical protein D6B26_06615 [Spirochaetaceae bacterium]
MNGIESWMEIINEESDGYQVHIHSRTPFGDRDSQEYISADLFQSCLRTGYLIPIETQAVS